MSTLVQAAGNLILQLIMNSVRELYLPKMELFADVVGQRAELAPLYERAAAAIERRDADAAAEAIGTLTAAQESAMLGRR
jgi:DNA-binding FadR family transcriptional regulator